MNAGTLVQCPGGRIGCVIQVAGGSAAVEVDGTCRSFSVESLETFRFPRGSKIEIREPDGRATLGVVDDVVAAGEIDTYIVKTQDGPRSVPSTHVAIARPPLDASTSPHSQLQHLVWAFPRPYDGARRLGNRHALREQQIIFEEHDGIRGYHTLLGAKVGFFAHQLAAVRRVLEDRVQRYVLADEVGLGKTVEAGMILHALASCSSNLSVLVVAPEAIAGQWQLELLLKFGRMFCATLGLEEQIPKRRDAVERLWKKTVNSTGVPRMILTDRAIASRGIRECVSDTAWSAIVVDEAHRFESGSKLHSWLMDLVARNPHSTVLALSGTPSRGRLEGLLGLYQLTDPDGYSGLSLAEFESRIQNSESVFHFLGDLKALLWTLSNNRVSPSEYQDELTSMLEDLAPGPWISSRIASIVADGVGDDREKALAAGRVLDALVREHLQPFRRIIRTRRSVLAETQEMAPRELVEKTLNVSPAERVVLDQLSLDGGPTLHFPRIVFQDAACGSPVELLERLRFRLGVVESEQLHSARSNEDIANALLSAGSPAAAIEAAEDCLRYSATYDGEPDWLKLTMRSAESWRLRSATAPEWEAAIQREYPALTNADSRLPARLARAFSKRPITSRSMSLLLLVSRILDDSPSAKLVVFFHTEERVSQFILFLEVFEREVELVGRRRQSGWYRRFTAKENSSAPQNPASRASASRASASRASASRASAARQFQMDPGCRVLFCDETAGEGLNLDAACAIIHADQPWSPSQIEQRIGRLQRLPRSPDRPVVSFVLRSDGEWEEWTRKAHTLLDVYKTSLAAVEPHLPALQSSLLMLLASTEARKQTLYDEFRDSVEQARRSIEEDAVFDVGSEHLARGLRLKQSLEVFADDLLLQDLKKLGFWSRDVYGINVRERDDSIVELNLGSKKLPPGTAFREPLPSFVRATYDREAAMQDDLLDLLSLSHSLIAPAFTDLNVLPNGRLAVGSVARSSGSGRPRLWVSLAIRTEPNFKAVELSPGRTWQLRSYYSPGYDLLHTRCTATDDDSWDTEFEDERPYESVAFPRERTHDRAPRVEYMELRDLMVSHPELHLVQLSRAIATTIELAVKCIRERRRKIRDQAIAALNSDGSFANARAYAEWTATRTDEPSLRRAAEGDLRFISAAKQAVLNELCHVDSLEVVLEHSNVE